MVMHKHFTASETNENCVWLKHQREDHGGVFGLFILHCLLVS